MKNNYFEVRRNQYDYHGKLYPYVNDWKKHPYTFLKARFYMEASAVLVYFLLKTKIKPNTITLIYTFCGIIGGVLLAIPTKTTILLALFIFFTKGILDWSDGQLARIKNQTSLTGYILDPYGALINSIGFWVGLSFYLAHTSKMIIFYYLAPLYPILLAANPLVFGNNMLVGTIIMQGWGKLNLPVMQQNIGETNSSLVRPKNRLFVLVSEFYLKGFPDDRARTIDFVCLLIVLELMTGIFVARVIFALFLLKQLLIFAYAFYRFYFKKSIVNTALDLERGVKNG